MNKNKHRPWLNREPGEYRPFPDESEDEIAAGKEALKEEEETRFLFLGLFLNKNKEDSE